MSTKDRINDDYEDNGIVERTYKMECLTIFLAISAIVLFFNRILQPTN